MVHCIQAYSSLYFLIFLSLQILKITNFCHTFLGNSTYEAYKVETWYTPEQWYVSCIPDSGCCCLFVPVFLHFSFFQNFQTQIFVTLFLRNCELKLGTHVDNGGMYRICWNQAAAAAYLSLFSSYFFLSNFQTLKIFITLFSVTVGPTKLKLGTNFLSQISWLLLGEYTLRVARYNIVSWKWICTWTIILSQNATGFYFDNISFLQHVLNQLFLPNESSSSQASYRTMILTICFQLFKKQTILWRKVGWKIWNQWWYTSIRHATCISCNLKDVLISEIPIGILYIFKW